MIDEDIRQHHRSHFQAAVQRAVLRKSLQHLRAKTADRAFLDRDQHLVILREAKHQVDVERLGEARIGDRRGEPMRRQRVGGLHAFGKPRSVRQQRDRVAFAQDAALADFERYAEFRHIDADAVSARIAKADGAVIDAPPPSRPCAPVPPRRRRAISTKSGRQPR